MRSLGAKHDHVAARKLQLHAMLPRQGGSRAGKGRVSRIWRRDGLKVPKKKRKTRARLWLGLLLTAGTGA